MLDKIYDLHSKSEAEKEKVEKAKAAYNNTLKELEKERRKFKKVMGIKSFDFVEYWCDMWNNHNDGMPGWMISFFIIPLGFFFLFINIMPFLLLFGTGLAALISAIILTRRFRKNKND